MLLFNAILASLAVAVAAAVLSVFVVLRRWAYLGDGISHAGFGGVGTAMLLAMAVPAMNNEASIYLVGAAFALATAAAVAWISRRGIVSGDAAVGIFVAGTFAWGFIAFAIHDHLGHGGGGNWETYLLGNVRDISSLQAILAASIAVATVFIVYVMHRQIIIYCFDPVLAEVSGVPAGFIHYLLIMMVGLVIIVGMRLAGNLLFPPMLVLPGAIGLAVASRMRTVIYVSIASSVLATLIGLFVTHLWNYILPGPAMVGALFIQFLIAHLLNRNRAGDIS